MAKLEFPAVGAPYRGFIGEVRGWFNRIASFYEKSPGSETALNSQIAVLAAETGFTTELPATQAIVTNADTFNGVTGTGTIATFTVSGGVITAIALSS